MRNGILIWDAMIQDILDNGELFNKQVCCACVAAATGVRVCYDFNW